MIFCVPAMLPELYMPSLNWDSDVKADFVATVADVLRGTPVGYHILATCFFFTSFCINWLCRKRSMWCSKEGMILTTQYLKTPPTGQLESFCQGCLYCRASITFRQSKTADSIRSSGDT